MLTLPARSHRPKTVGSFSELEKARKRTVTWGLPNEQLCRHSQQGGTPHVPEGEGAPGSYGQEGGAAGLPPPGDTIPCQAETELDVALSWTDPVWDLAAELGQFSDLNSTPSEPAICLGRSRPEREAGVRQTPASARS